MFMSEMSLQFSFPFPSSISGFGIEVIVTSWEKNEPSLMHSNLWKNLCMIDITFLQMFYRIHLQKHLQLLFSLREDSITISNGKISFYVFCSFHLSFQIIQHKIVHCTLIIFSIIALSIVVFTFIPNSVCVFFLTLVSLVRYVLISLVLNLKKDSQLY